MSDYLVPGQKILLTRTFSTTSNLLPRAFESTHKFNLLTRKCSDIKFCCRELSWQQVTCCRGSWVNITSPSSKHLVEIDGLLSLHVPNSKISGISCCFSMPRVKFILCTSFATANYPNPFSLTLPKFCKCSTI